MKHLYKIIKIIEDLEKSDLTESQKKQIKLIKYNLSDLLCDIRNKESRTLTSLKLWYIALRLILLMIKFLFL